MACTVLVTAACLIWSMAVAPAIKGLHQWWIPPDAWVSLEAGEFVFAGAYAYMYEANDFFVAFPGIAVALVPVAWAISVWHLSESRQGIVVPRPTAWPLLAVVGCALTLPALHAIQTLATRVRQRATWPTVAGAALLAAGPAAVVYGHFEDVVAVGLVVVAVRLALDERLDPAGLAMAGAVLFKQWALLGILPLLALAPDRRSAARTATIALAIPAALVAPCFIALPSTTAKAIFRAQAFPTLGHRALWASAVPHVVATPFRLLPFVVSAVVAWRIHRSRVVATADVARIARVAAAFGVAFLARVVFEPVIYAYYLAPAFAFALLHAAGRGRLRVIGFGTLLIGFFITHPPTAVWWLVAVVLGLCAFGPMVRDGLLVGRGAVLDAASDS